MEGASPLRPLGDGLILTDFWEVVKMKNKNFWFFSLGVLLVVYNTNGTTFSVRVALALWAIATLAGAFKKMSDATKAVK